MAMETSEAPSKIFVTCNSEYGVRDQRIVAVRPRGERRWLSSHRALGMRVIGDPQEVSIGDCLRLAGGDDSLLTSRIVDVKRGPLLSTAA